MKLISEITKSDAVELINASLSGMHFGNREKVQSIDIDGNWVTVTEEKKPGKWFELTLNINSDGTFVYTRLRLWEREEYQFNQLTLINKLKELGYL